MSSRLALVVTASRHIRSIGERDGDATAGTAHSPQSDDTCVPVLILFLDQVFYRSVRREDAVADDERVRSLTRVTDLMDRSGSCQGDDGLEEECESVVNSKDVD